VLTVVAVAFLPLGVATIASLVGAKECIITPKHHPLVLNAKVQESVKVAAGFTVLLATVQD
jgi:hypothetical protein